MLRIEFRALYMVGNVLLPLSYILSPSKLILLANLSSSIISKCVFSIKHLNRFPCWLSLTINLIQPRNSWEIVLVEELSSSDLPVGMPVEDCLDC